MQNKLNIDQKSGVRLIIYCSISPNYPIDSSLFLIQSGDSSGDSSRSSQIQYLEELVNLRIPAELENNPKKGMTHMTHITLSRHCLVGRHYIQTVIVMYYSLVYHMTT